MRFLSSRGRLIQLFVFAAYASVADSAIVDMALSFDCTPAVLAELGRERSRSQDFNLYK
jgi:hypothetical protein